MEEWRAVKVDSRYEVSNLGEVRNASTKKVFAATPRKNGYISVMFTSTDGKQKRYYAHRLVADAFLGGIEEDQVVNHLNFVRHDNRSDNLEVTTTLENVRHSVRAGHLALNGENSPKGEAHSISKVSESDVHAIRSGFSDGRTKASLSREFGVTPPQIANIINRVSWAHI